MMVMKISVSSHLTGAIVFRWCLKLTRFWRLIAQIIKKMLEIIKVKLISTTLEVRILS